VAADAVPLATLDPVQRRNGIAMTFVLDD